MNEVYIFFVTIWAGCGVPDNPSAARIPSRTHRPPDEGITPSKKRQFGIAAAIMGASGAAGAMLVSGWVEFITMRILLKSKAPICADRVGPRLLSLRQLTK